MNRIVGYDIARACAIFGMIIVNFKQVMAFGASDPGWLARVTSLMEGRFSALFVILAGIGISLLTQKARVTQDPVLSERKKHKLLKRAAFLLVTGLLFFPIWKADILHFYAAYLFFAAFALPASNNKLLVYSMLSMVLFVGLFFILDYDKGWDWDTITYVSFWTPAGAARNLFFNGYHPVFPWISFLFLGMFIGRMNMSAIRNQRRLFVIGLTSALVAELLSRILLRVIYIDDQDMLFGMPIRELLGTRILPPTPLYVISAAGTAAALIAVACAVGEHFSNTRLLRPLVATGQLALTIYIGHVIVGMGFLTLIDRINRQTLPFAVIVSLMFCAGSIIFSHFWLQRFKHGPLESVMRRLTS